MADSMDLVQQRVEEEPSAPHPHRPQQNAGRFPCTLH